MIKRAQNVQIRIFFPAPRFVTEVEKRPLNTDVMRTNYLCLFEVFRKHCYTFKTCSDVALPRNCLVGVKKHQKCKFVPRLLSMIVGIRFLYGYMSTYS